MIKLLTVIFILTCGCAPAITVRIMHEPVAVVDTVPLLLIMGTKEDSVIDRETYVKGLKDSLLIDARKSVHDWGVMPIEWSGDFVNVVHLEAWIWADKWSETEKRFFVWYRDPIRNEWIMKEE